MVISLVIVASASIEAEIHMVLEIEHWDRRSYYDHISPQVQVAKFQI